MSKQKLISSHYFHLPKIILILILFVFSESIMANLEPLGSEDQKIISIRSENKANDLEFKIISERSSIKAMSSIRFKVSANERFYLYLFSMNPKNGSGVMILPNRLQDKNNVRYAPNKWHTVPDSRLEFFADKPGKERILVVASKRYIDTDRLLKRSGSKALGDYYFLESVSDGLDNALSDLLDNTSKGVNVRVRRKSSPLPRGVIIQELNLRIK